MQKWKCTVCGYIYEGDAPPEICPVCGAEKNKFIQITDEELLGSKNGLNQEKKTISLPISGTRFNGIFRLMVKHHAHPISSHLPNGIIPLTILFILFSALLSSENFSLTALYNMVFVLISLPFVICSGYIEWQLKYNGNLTGLFKTKIVSALITFLLSLVLTIWFFINPEVVTSVNIVFILLALIWLAAVTIAGYLGGKLVFKD
ncbi:MAG TPA: DUF2231 domain-containing protein [Desulfohalobiaceae bacterium]|nr:DUF2231 domain-containing protein [Desulfohalobiaceae bacterium]